jgi:DNA-binding MarR family transcriptional regulator
VGAAAVLQTLGRNLGAAAHLARAVFDVQLGRVGEINAAQAVALKVLACERTTSREQLCRDLSVGSEEFAATVAPLSDRGYVTEDAQSVAITTEGERVIAALWAVQERVEETPYAGFSVAQRDQLRDMLRRIQDNATQLIGPIEQ